MPYVGGHSEASSTPSRPGCAGADVEEAAAVSKRRFRLGDGARDGLALRRDRVGNGSIFSVNEVDDLQRGREIDVSRARIPALGQSGVDERHVTG